MAPEPAAWTVGALRILGMLFGLLLVIQYALGLWTNAYAPAAGFTSNSSSASLDWHYNIGFALSILAIIVVIVAALSRQVRWIAPSLVMLAAVIVAGLAGGAFVPSNPNSANDAIVMGLAFLVAFAGGVALSFSPWQGVSRAPAATPAATGAS